MIEVKDVSFSYNTKELVLDAISMSIADKEWISVIGQNGSGKSTLAKLLVGLIFPKEGSITYNGMPITEKTVNTIRHKIGIVFQNPDNQFVGFNVRYDVAFGLENYQVPREKMIPLIEEYTRKVDMQNYLEREPQTLSGGQKQRVAIAGIMALNCETIILDEATSMLDPEGTKEIIEMIQTLHTKYNKTVITITHDLNLAKLSDRVIVLKEGKILSSGTPEEIFKNKELIRQANLDLPFTLKVIEEMSKKDILEKDKELMNALWEYHLSK